MMPTSANGWPALESGSPLLISWTIPTAKGESRVRLRNGSAGFLLVHYATYHADTIEPIVGTVLDDWGHAWRAIRGQSSGLSNHAAGCAIDLNATRHGLGRRGTYSRDATAKIRARLKLYEHAIRWGGDYTGRPDEMHFEINDRMSEVERIARHLASSRVGRRILDANKGQLEVIRA